MAAILVRNHYFEWGGGALQRVIVHGGKVRKCLCCINITYWVLYGGGKECIYNYNYYIFYTRHKLDPK